MNVKNQEINRNRNRAHSETLLTFGNIDNDDVYYTPESEEVNLALRRARLKIIALKRIENSTKGKLKDHLVGPEPLGEHIYDLPDLSGHEQKSSTPSLTYPKSDNSKQPSENSKLKLKICLLFIVFLLICGISGGVAVYLLLQDETVPDIKLTTQRNRIFSSNTGE